MWSYLEIKAERIHVFKVIAYILLNIPKGYFWWHDESCTNIGALFCNHCEDKVFFLQC